MDEGWVGNPIFIHAMSPRHNDSRFKRLREADGGVFGRGGYGEVFQGYDERRQEMVSIKRQCLGSASGKEAACFTMLQAFPHPNIVRMLCMWTATFDNNEYFYIATEVCSTNLWNYIGVGNPNMRDEFKQSCVPQQLWLPIMSAVGHLHSLGVVHGDCSLSNILLTVSGEVRLGRLRSGDCTYLFCE